ncbi:MAG: hypothetical protein V7708_05955 [Oceanicoccus sp.]
MYKTFLVMTLLGLSVSATHVFATTGTKTTIKYGNISAIEVTTEKSAIARNTILGGLAGIAIDDNTAGAFQGASAAFAITSIVEGDRRVFLYTISLDKGISKNVAIHHSGLSVGQCVSLEQDDKHTNIRPVSAVYCQSPDHEALTSPNVVDRQQSIADACNKAIKAVHKAKNDTDIDKALIQMRALCE